MDAGVMIEAIHHLNDPGPFMRSLIAYLLQGAHLYIIDPVVNKPFGTMEGCYSDPTQSKKLMEEAGFKVVDITWKEILDLQFYTLSEEVPVFR